MTDSKIIQPPEPGPVHDKTFAERCEVVVDSIAVESFSQRGYRTIEIREEDISTYQMVNNQEVLPGNTYHTTVSKQVPVVLRVLRFHMVCDGESRIAALSASFETARVECEALRIQVSEGDAAIAALKSSMERLETARKQHLALLAAEQKISADFREALRKAEETIAKIRKEIGERRWREITDPDPTMMETEKARIASLDLDDAEPGAR